MSHPLPDEAKKYFWGDNLTELSWPEHKQYIIQTLLDRGDRASLRWLFSKVTKKEVRELVPSLRLQEKSRNFWNVYLS